MELSALTRSVVKRNHAIIAPDGYINSVVPGWTNCTVNVIINEAMGARLCQTLVTANKEARMVGSTRESQLFFYIIKGKVKAIVSGEIKVLTAGQFVYIPVGKAYRLENIKEGTQVLSFHKLYEKLEGFDIPETIFGDSKEVAGPSYLGDSALRLQVLLPDHLSFDMAVNIFTYD